MAHARPNPNPPQPRPLAERIVLGEESEGEGQPPASDWLQDEIVFGQVAYSAAAPRSTTQLVTTDPAPKPTS